MKNRSFADKLQSWLQFDIYIACVAFTVLVTVTFFGVIMRYFVNKPLIWQEEIQFLTIIWVIFLGAGAAFRTGNHVAIEIIVDALPKKLKRSIELIDYLIVVAALVYICYQSSILVKQMYVTERVTNILHVPYYIVWGAVPFGCILSIINCTLVTFSSGGKPAPLSPAPEPT
ncbi:MAG: TRAP transporter small permease [Methylobacteriaceae bacterium]|jgi:TRAP-type C4-dicarboxylate transport system permease small subunit|nr:TRAP transporter small permease [Methylobacteriaceae bacterium]